MATAPIQYKTIPLDGKLVTSVDGVLANRNGFTVLENYRYITQGEKGITPVGGMAKINTTEVGTDVYPANVKIRSGIHFKKEQPSENHILVQAFNNGEDASWIYDNETAIPLAGDFSTTPIHTSAGTYIGRFNLLPDESVGFFSGEKSIVWSGEEARCGMFINYDGVGNTWSYDYTDIINNDLTDDANVATLRTSSDGYCYVLVGAQRPIKGAKWYVHRVNTTGSSSVLCYYWNKTAWTTCGTLTDGTKTAGVCLAKDGTTTFASTVTTANAHILHGIMQYFYLFKFYNLTNSSANTRPQITRLTLDMPMQGFTDLWDGVPRKIGQFWSHTTLNKFRDFTSNVYSQDIQQIPISGTPTYMSPTYFKASTFAVASYMIVCSSERCSGINWEMVKDRTNAAEAAIMHIYYNNGDSTNYGWVEVDGLNDTTADDAGTTSLNHSGMSVWSPPDPKNEFKISTIIDGEDSVNLPSAVYCYKIQWDHALDATCYIDCITTIPAQKIMHNYAYGFKWQNRTVLLREVSGQQNAIRISNQGTTSYFNGEDSWDDVKGTTGKLIAGGPLYTRYSDGKYEDALLISMDKTYLLSGTTPGGDDKFRIRCIDETMGCTDHNSFDVCKIIMDNGESRNVAIWKSSMGMVAFNGISVEPIDSDISDLFNPLKSTNITPYQTGSSYGRFDPVHGDYHWCYGSSSSTFDKEKLFSIRKQGWSDIVRTPQTSNPRLYGIIPVSDTYGNKYCYGFTITGYLERLEYGNDFDGNDITYKFRTVDSPLLGEDKALVYPTRVDRIKLLMVANSSADTIATKLYDDTLTAGYTVPEYPTQVDATHRVKQVTITPNDADWGIFHSIECISTMDDIGTGFEILGAIVAFTESSSPDMGG